MISKSCRIVFVLFLLTVVFSQVRAQTDFRIHSVFIYNFTRLIAWPGEYRSGDFIIAVFGSSPITHELTEMSKTRKVGSQNIDVVTFNSPADITRCHIIYIPANQSRHIRSITEMIRSRNINALIVTDSRNSITEGSVINFTVVDGRQRFELSPGNAARMGLTVGSELERLAIISE